jgi:hypothetical protein
MLLKNVVASFMLSNVFQHLPQIHMFEILARCHYDYSSG